MSQRISLDRLLDEEVGKFLSWPRFSLEVAKRRLHEIRGLGVVSISSVGPHKVEGIPVLGKGHVGIVLMAHLPRADVALKILRTDAGRRSMRREAEMLKVSNSVGVGPSLLAFSEGCLLMELVEGEYIGDWVSSLERGDDVRLKRVLRRLLMKARALDLIGLDHGELGRIKRHVIVSNDEPRIIDFESASTDRHSKNVTSVAQFLFVTPWMVNQISWIIPLPKRKQIIDALKGYSRDPNQESFKELLAFLDLRSNSG